jgi:hypothetical protein
VCSRRFAAQFLPTLRPGIAPPQPGQGDEVDLLVFAHAADDAAQFLKHGVLVGTVRKHLDYSIVGWIGGFLRDVGRFFGLEFARLRDNEANLSRETESSASISAILWGATSDETGVAFSLRARSSQEFWLLTASAAPRSPRVASL